MFPGVCYNQVQGVDPCLQVLLSVFSLEAHSVHRPLISNFGHLGKELVSLFTYHYFVFFFN